MLCSAQYGLGHLGCKLGDKLVHILIIKLLEDYCRGLQALVDNSEYHINNFHEVVVACGCDGAHVARKVYNLVGESDDKLSMCIVINDKLNDVVNSLLICIQFEVQVLANLIN